MPARASEAAHLTRASRPGPHVLTAVAERREPAS
jgi:hypothetical protein